MNEKDQKDQPFDGRGAEEAKAEGGSADKARGLSREDRLAEALRANLRRRKTAAKTRKDG